MDHLPEKLLFSMFGKFSKRVHSYLCQNSEYYNQLSPELQRRFAVRARAKAATYQFEMGDGPPLDKNTALLTVAGLTKLTFGYKKFIFKAFRYVCLRKNTYTHRLVSSPMQGHVANQQIHLSIPHVDYGFHHPTDGINIVIHEAAHALVLENKVRKDRNKLFDPKVSKQWDELALIKIAAIRDKTETFFRDYGGVNQMEFFAVAMESFFERPVEFKKIHPELYKIATELLLQDPIKASNPLIEVR